MYLPNSNLDLKDKTTTYLGEKNFIGIVYET